MKSDGLDIWVANIGSGTVSRVRASSGNFLSEWTGATSARGVLVAMGRVFATGYTSPGKLYMIDPSAAARRRPGRAPGTSREAPASSKD